MTGKQHSVRILRRAQNDLVEIYRYILSDRPDAADRFVGKLVDAIESLEINPARGTVPRDQRLRDLGYRVLIQGDHLVFYKVLPRQVRVYRVLHGRRRYADLL